MIHTDNSNYPEIENDYYYKLGYLDALKNKMYWRSVAFTAGFFLTFEILKEIL